MSNIVASPPLIVLPGGRAVASAAGGPQTWAWQRTEDRCASHRRANRGQDGLCGVCAAAWPCDCEERIQRP